MKITPLAADSLGARSMATLVETPDVTVLIDGPMTHMPENYPEARTKQSITNLLRIVRTTPVRTLIVDHHALRDREWRTRMEPVLRAGEEHDVGIRTAAEFAGKAVDQLETNRDVLHGLPPAGPDLPPQES